MTAVRCCWLLYPEAEDKLGKVEWFTDFMGGIGMPLKCWVRIRRENDDVWMIEYPVALGNESDEAFTKYMLECKLLNYWQSYKHVHPRTAPAEFGDSPIRVSKVILNDTGKIVKFEGRLFGGQAITAELNDDFDPSSILVDGKTCPFWDTVCAEACQNVDKIVHELRTTP
jgi:hypothetical protein